MWSIAAVLESADRQLLEEYIKADLKGEMNLPKLKVNPGPFFKGNVLRPERSRFAYYTLFFGKQLKPSQAFFSQSIIIYGIILEQLALFY